MIRVVVIGDAHFQSTSSRNAERIRAIEQIVAEGLALPDLGAWIWLGDVFHTRSTADDRMLVADILQRQAAVAPVCVIYGNHEVSLDLHIFGQLAATHPIYVVARPATIRLVTPTGRALSVFAVPFPHKAGLVANGVAHQNLGEAARAALDVIFMQGAADLEDARKAGDYTLLAGHATLAGSLTSVGQPMGIDGDIAIDAGLLARFGDIPKVFGHIHKPQELYGAYYAGSIAPTDWGETEQKRHLVVEFYGDSHRVLSRVIDTAPLYHVEGELARDGFTWHVVNGEPPTCSACDGTGRGDGAPDCSTCFYTPGVSWDGCEVRVRYRFNANEKSVLDEALVRAPFEGAKRLELDPIGVRERASRAPEVAAATTLEAKVEAFVRRSMVPWTTSMETKLAGLQSPDGAAFLTDVQQSLSGPQPPAPLLSPPAAPGQAVGPDNRQEVGAL